LRKYSGAPARALRLCPHFVNQFTFGLPGRVYDCLSRTARHLPLARAASFDMKAGRTDPARPTGTPDFFVRKSHARAGVEPGL
jgi:hypothetical protein